MGFMNTKVPGAPSFCSHFCSIWVVADSHSCQANRAATQGRGEGWSGRVPQGLRGMQQPTWGCCFWIWPAPAGPGLAVRPKPTSAAQAPRPTTPHSALPNSAAGHPVSQRRTGAAPHHPLAAAQGPRSHASTGICSAGPAQPRTTLGLQRSPVAGPQQPGSRPTRAHLVDRPGVLAQPLAGLHTDLPEGIHGGHACQRGCHHLQRAAGKQGAGSQADRAQGCSREDAGCQAATTCSSRQAGGAQRSGRQARGRGRAQF